MFIIVGGAENMRHTFWVSQLISCTAAHHNSLWLCKASPFASPRHAHEIDNNIYRLKRGRWFVAGLRWMVNRHISHCRVSVLAGWVNMMLWCRPSLLWHSLRHGVNHNWFPNIAPEQQQQRQQRVKSTDWEWGRMEWELKRIEISVFTFSLHWKWKWFSKSVVPRECVLVFHAKIDFSFDL